MKIKQNPRHMWTNREKPNKYLIVLDIERQNKAETIFKEMIAKNSPNLMKIFSYRSKKHKKPLLGLM